MSRLEDMEGSVKDCRGIQGGAREEPWGPEEGDKGLKAL